MKKVIYRPHQFHDNNFVPDQTAGLIKAQGVYNKGINSIVYQKLKIHKFVFHFDELKYLFPLSSYCQTNTNPRNRHNTQTQIHLCYTLEM